MQQSLQSSKQKDQNSQDQRSRSRRPFWKRLTAAKKSPENAGGPCERSKSQAQMFKKVGSRKDCDQHPAADRQDPESVSNNEQTTRQRKTSTFRTMLGNKLDKWSRSPSTTRGLKSELKNNNNSKGHDQVQNKSGKTERDGSAVRPAQGKPSLMSTNSHQILDSQVTHAQNVPQFVFARPATQIKENYMTPMCTYSLTQRSVESGKQNDCPEVDQVQYSVENLVPNNQSVHQSQQQTGHTVAEERAIAKQKAQQNMMNVNVLNHSEEIASDSKAAPGNEEDSNSKAGSESSDRTNLQLIGLSKDIDQIQKTKDQQLCSSPYGTVNSIEGGELERRRNMNSSNQRARQDRSAQDGKKLGGSNDATRLHQKETEQQTSTSRRQQREAELTSDVNGAEEGKMTVKFEESQLPSPMSAGRADNDNRNERSAAHAHGMQNDGHGDSSSFYSEREDLLQEHREKYKAYKEFAAAEAKSATIWDYKAILRQMQEEPIRCIKYNYSIDPEGQNHLQFDALLQVSPDGKDLLIFNKKPDDNPEYIPEAEPEEVKRQRDIYKEASKEKTEENKPNENNTDMGNAADPHEETNSDDQCTQNEDEGDIDLDDRRELERLKDQFHLKKSSACTEIQDIQGIIYGGISSRFWVYRKHLICMDYDKIKKNSKHNRKFDGDKSGVIPFFAWQCITLDLKDRYVDLVIKNEQKMKLFLKFLVMSLKTVDGVRGSAEKTFQQLYLCEVMRREKQLKKLCFAKKGAYKKEALVLSEEAKEQIRQVKWKEIYQRTLFRYTLMKIRSKIAYQAFQSRMSINELFISQICDSYYILTENGDIRKVADYSQECIDKFDDILDGDFNSCMQKLIQHNLDPVVRRRKETLYRQRELRDLGLRSADQLGNKSLQQQVGNLFQNNISKLLRAKEDALQRQKELALGKKKTREFSHESLSRDSSAKSEGRTLNRQKLTRFEHDEEAAQARKMIDKQANMQNLQGGFGLFDKSKCMDIFANVKVDGMQMYDQRSTKAKFHYKVIRRIIEKQLTKVRFMIAVGGLIDIFYIKCILRKISLMKKMFVLELEQGQEVFIPRDLTCDNYPISYHYYDPIIQIVNHFFSAESRLYFTLKTEFNLSRLKDSDWQKQFLIRLGVYESDETCKLTYKHQLINIKERDELKHTESQHALSLQKSRYLVVESNAERLKNLADFQVSQKALEANRAGSTIILDHAKSIEDMPLNLRFCHKREVNLKRQKFVHFKQCFLVRQDHLKNQGQKFHSLVMMQRHIETNLDKLFEENCPLDENYRRYREQTNPNFGKEQEQLQNSRKTGADTVGTSNQEEEGDPLVRKQQDYCKMQREKQKYGAYLLDTSEKLIKKRRAGMRRKEIKQVYRKCDKNIDFAQKNAFLEEKIEATQKYFNYMNDFHHPGQDLQKIRKQLYKVNKRVKKAKTLSVGGNHSNGNMSQVENEILQQKASQAKESNYSVHMLTLPAE